MALTDKINLVKQSKGMVFNQLANVFSTQLQYD